MNNKAQGTRIGGTGAAVLSRAYIVLLLVQTRGEPSKWTWTCKPDLAGGLEWSNLRTRRQRIS